GFSRVGHAARCLPRAVSRLRKLESAWAGSGGIANLAGDLARAYSDRCARGVGAVSRAELATSRRYSCLYVLSAEPRQFRWRWILRVPRGLDCVLCGGTMADEEA